MFEEHFNELISKDWSMEDKALIERVCKSLSYYKKLIPTTLKNDIVYALEMCNRLKGRMEELERQLGCKMDDQAEWEQVEKDDSVKNEDNEKKQDKEEIKIANANAI